MEATVDTSLCLIVRDAEATLDRLFASITYEGTKPADEIVVDDTGSTDGTVEKLHSWRERLAALGCALHVVDSPWPGKDERGDGGIARFALARQRCFDRARGVWRGYFDADDYLDDGWARAYAGMPAQAGPEVDAIIVPYLYYVPEEGAPDAIERQAPDRQTVSARSVILRRVAWVRWERDGRCLWRWRYRVHEVTQRQGEPAGPESVMRVIAPCVRHAPMTEADLRRKTARNREYLLEEVLDPETPREDKNRARGYLCLEALSSDQVEDARAVLIPARVNPDDDDMVAKGDEVLRARSAVEPVRSLAILALGSPQAWHARSPEDEGCGGSEEAVVYLAREAAQAGIDVTVYGAAREESLDGVRWVPDQAWEAKGTGADLVLAWRGALVARVLRPGQRAFLWAHDTDVGRCDAEDLAAFDAILTLSEFQERRLEETYPTPARPPCVRIGNALPESAFAPPAPRDTHRVVYASSPDRGLIRLLALWPEVRVRVPDARLDIFYGVDTLAAMAEQDPAAAGVLGEVRLLMRETRPGVRWRGRVDQRTLAREMRAAGVWAYPTTFPEVFCTTAIRAEAAGLAVVATDAGALPEVCLLPDDLIPLDAAQWTDAVAAAFLAKLIEALESPPSEAERTALSDAARRWTWRAALERIVRAACPAQVR